jgi:hypothetical protein
MSTRQVAETIAQSTTPIPVGISGLSWLGIMIKDWVLIGTAILIAFQLIVIAPKVCRILYACQGNIRTKIKETIRYGKSK